MSSVGSLVPLVFSGDERRHSHAVHLYAEDAELTGALGAFVAKALDAGDSAIVIATHEHRHDLECYLRTRTGNFAKAAEQGRYLALDAEASLSLFMVEGWPDATRFFTYFSAVLRRSRAAARNPDSSVALFGEMVALLWAEGKFAAAIEIEKLWNDLSRTQPFHLRCGYSVGVLNYGPELNDLFHRMCGEHSRVIKAESDASAADMQGELRNLPSLQQMASMEVEAAWRKKAQKALRQRESELADVLENALEGIQRSGPDRNILWANKALLGLLGYSRDEYVGHCLAEFFVDSRTADDFWARLMRREEVYDFAADMRCRDGSVKHVLIHSNGLWDGQRFVHSRTFLRDVTDRLQSEQDLKRAHDELERRVAERTAELQEKNNQILRQSEKLSSSNQGLRKLSARLMQAQDEERRRIARDLHDSTGQTLALLSMNLSALEVEAERLDRELARGLADNASLVRQISAELRTLSYVLHPPLLDEMGLEAALRWYADGFAERSNIRVQLELPESWKRLPNDLEIAIFRVIQECLTNIHRHSGSPTALIRLYESAGNVVLEVTDEGKGIAQEKLHQISSFGAPGVGLRGMRERIKHFGGELEVMSPARGAGIRMAIPITSA